MRSVQGSSSLGNLNARSDEAMTRLLCTAGSTDLATTTQVTLHDAFAVRATVTKAHPMDPKIIELCHKHRIRRLRATYRPGFKGGGVPRGGGGNQNPRGWGGAESSKPQHAVPPALHHVHTFHNTKDTTLSSTRWSYTAGCYTTFHYSTGVIKPCWLQRPRLAMLKRSVMHHSALWKAL